MARKPKVPPFETALEKLETTVRQLEGGEISLEESLSLFEEGVKLSRQCAEQLDTAEQRVMALVNTSDGAVAVEPFPTPDNASQA